MFHVKHFGKVWGKNLTSSRTSGRVGEVGSHGKLVLLASNGLLSLALYATESDRRQFLVNIDRGNGWFLAATPRLHAIRLFLKHRKSHSESPAVLTDCPADRV
jgi:hypothetical protein